MKTGSITYNGKNSLTDLGIYVTGSGSFDAAELDVDRYEVAGRNGDIIIPKNRYKNISISYPAFIPKGFDGKVQSVRNWLRSAKTYARLEDTYDMNHYRLGLASGIQSFEPANRNDASNFALTFDCKPQRFLKTGETPLTVEPEAHTYSGEIVSFETVAVDDMTKAEVSLSPIQSGSGDPSPTNVRPITGHDSATLNIGAEYPTADETYPVTFPQTVYGGTFDWVTGQGEITMAYVDLGTLTWSNSGTNTTGVFRVAANLPLAKLPSAPSIVANAVCSAYPMVSANNTYTKATGCSINTAAAQVIIYDPNYNDGATATVAAFKSAMSGVQLVYELATPIQLSLTPHEIDTLLGQNVMWGNGEIEIAFSEPFSLTNPTQFEARPLLRVVNPEEDDVIDINGTTITFTDDFTGEMFIDCESMDAFSSSGTNLNSYITATDFPVLKEGLNIVTFTGSGDIYITPRWWEL